MVCYSPLIAYRSKDLLPSGKRGLVFDKKLGFSDLEIKVPCGQCIGCRLERSRQWALRCSHEASLYVENCFITLTYDDANLPPFGSLRFRDFQLFMKRLRKKYPERKIRYYHCGEYGENNRRPHYHSCLFNFDFEDKILFKTKDNYRLYVSKILQELWPFGMSIIGDVNFQSAAYVARYVMKKVNGALEDIYQVMDEETGEVGFIEKEYSTMSRRPGIGLGWYEKFKTDVYPSDFYVVNGKKVRPPKYYDSKFEVEDSEGFKKVKLKRIRRAKKHGKNNSISRLNVRERCAKARVKLLKREIEE